VGRELLRGRNWQRALRHYFTAGKNDHWNKMVYAGMAAALLHVGGGATEFDSESIEEPETSDNLAAGTKHRIGLL
jgi:hypothetical protein